MAGMEVLFCSVQRQIKDGGGALVCCLHWNMITNGFECIGIGEKAPDKNVKGSELLPSGWADSPDVYTLLYKASSGTVHLLKVIRMDSSLFIHVMRLSDEKAAGMSINIGDYTNEDLSSYESAFRDLDKLSKHFKKEVLDEVCEGKASSQASVSQETQRRRRQEDDDDPLRIPLQQGQRQPAPDWGEPSNPFSIGRGDLDPLAGGRGGGMLMDPWRSGVPVVGPDPSAGLPGRLPRGAVPPGARFDPFGPPDLDSNPGFGRGTGGRRPGPDPDHLPPPGYDDMFM